MARTPQLLDAYGQPVRRAELTQPQARPGVTGVRPTFADSVASGLTPQRLAGILRQADQGDIARYAILAQEMEERDPHYASVLGVRKRAVSGVAPIVEPASESAEDKRIAEAVEAEIAQHDAFANLVEALLDGLGKGFSVVEIDWKRTARAWWPRGFEWVDQRFITFDRETGQFLRLIDAANRVEGVALAPYNYLVHRPNLKSGHVARGGIARLVAFGWICKAYTMKDWMAFAETYGLPMRVGRYGPQATKEDVDQLFKAVANIGSDAAAVLPESMKIDFEAVGGGTSREGIFENLLRYVDEQISKAVLGQTMTSDNGSSQAQAKVHNDVRLDVADADARAVNGTIARDLVKPFVDLNFGARDAYPRVLIRIEEPEDTAMIMEQTAKLATAGTRFKAEEVRRRLGYTDPEDGDEVIGGAAPSAPAGDAPPAPTATNALATNALALAAEDGGADEIDALVDEMGDRWEPVMEETLDPIEAALDAATDLEDFRRRLAQIADLPAAQLIDALVKGTFKARAVGDDRDG